ncbi:MAG: tRNA (adenosine(37)-N6)-threonylcarbamoyltransferase complex ATPase subunit type 1 TsaE [Alphaproteobacteria bacterium]|nr:tRNA (adenosine(37)-N6)-threonylcarbamoyltransferase complex ATPase subunit type 1 TsaE [Alphaproteobacteria bacterium]
MSVASASRTEPLTVIALPDLAATDRFAGLVAGRARHGDVIGLAGELGTGKTTFARAFIRALAGADEEVPSPTFTLLQTYDSRAGPIYHFDLYRLVAPDEAWELGIEEAFAHGISLIEWPERLGPLLPEDTLCLTLRAAAGGDPNARGVEVSCGPSWRDRMAAVCADMGQADDD